MFQQARINLTAQYLIIIMLISFFFSLIIYLGINRELIKFEQAENLRQQRAENLSPFLEELQRIREERGLPPPRYEIEIEPVVSIPEVRTRILSILGLINLIILGVSGVAGYYLAGKTLGPIQVMMDEQKEFVGNASHELRTPLTSLKSEIEVALRDKKLALTQAKGLLKSNLEEVDRMHKLSNYLLTLNRYESGKASFVFSKVNLKDVAEKAVEKVKAQAKANKIKIVKKLQNAKVSGNENSLVELAGILLDNAVKYSASASDVIISTKTHGRSAILTVQDFGLGIGKEDIPRIFDRFYRAETSRSKEKRDGYGLGLAIAKSIVEMHGGKISVESSPNKGSKFEVRFF